MNRELRSIAGVCEVVALAAPAARSGAVPDLLVEVPHGATTQEHFDALRRRMRSDLPADLSEFFFVNTDVGAPECALETARLFVGSSAAPRKALVLRGLLPRTFVDCNRILGSTPDSGAGLTPAIPAYVTAGEDVRLLEDLYGSYQRLVGEAYEQVCGSGGLALILHSYAPRSVGIEHIDRSIVDQLHDAYSPGRYEAWPLRPAVDIISEDEEGACLAPRPLVEAIKESYARIGIRPAENATYRLHRETTGHRHSARHSGRVLCMEISRDLLADPFDPFSEMRIGEAKVQSMSAPLAAACRHFLDRDGSRPDGLQDVYD